MVPGPSVGTSDALLTPPTGDPGVRRSLMGAMRALPIWKCGLSPLEL